MTAEYTGIYLRKCSYRKNSIESNYAHERRNGRKSALQKCKTAGDGTDRIINQ